MGRPFPFLLFYGILYGRRTVFGSPARYAPVWRRGAETPGRPPRPRNALSAGGFGAADPGAGAAAESVSGRAAPDGCVICAAAGAEAWPWVCVPYGAGVWPAGQPIRARSARGVRVAPCFAVQRPQAWPCAAPGAPRVRHRRKVRTGCPAGESRLFSGPCMDGRSRPVFACVWRKCERTGRSLTWT